MGAKYPISLSHILDFYYLEALSAFTDEKLGSKAGEKWREDVLRERADLAGQLALSFRNYLFVAGVGEMRHASNRCKWWLAEIPPSATRSEACSLSMQYDPTNNFPSLVEGFNQHWPGGGYGGPKWAACMQAGAQYGVWSDVMFVDHAVDLEHNGGCVFDKSSAASLVYLSLTFSWPGLGMKYFLDLKRDHDLLVYDVAKKTGEAAPQLTATTWSLWTRWWNIFNGGTPDWVSGFMKNPRDWPTYDKKQPTFGTKIFTREVKHYVEAAQSAQEFNTPRAYAVYGEEEGEFKRGEQQPDTQSQEGQEQVVGVPQRKYAYLPS
jgi:hypothetical protein